MRAKKLTATLLLLSMLTSLAACGDAATETTADTADTAAVTETERETTAEEARLATPDDLPDTKFDGDTFTVLCYDHTSWTMTVEEMTGDVVDDAIYNRNLNVSERFDVKLAFESIDSYGNASTTVRSTVQAGDDHYQIAAYHFIQMGRDLQSGVFLNLNDVPYINFDKPWWSDTTVEDMTYKGVTFLGFGFIGLSNVRSAYCLLYNKDLAAEYSLPNVYEYVNEGTWTKEKMKEQAAIVAADLNGDGTLDNTDRYGMAFDLNGACDQFFWFFGKKIYTRQDDGSYADTYYDEKLVNYMEWMNDFAFNGGYTYTEKSWSVAGPMFEANNTLMVVCGIGSGLSFRDSDIDYGIIPAPKWDEAQEDYVTVADGSSDAIAVLQTTQNLERAGIITEALTAGGWKLMVPAYFDIALKHKGTRDEESAAILDMIIENVIYDFGYVFGGESSSTNPGFWTHKMLQQKSADITSHYEKTRNAYESNMKGVIDYYEGYLDK